MQQPIQIVFREITSSPSIEADIYKRAEKLERICHNTISCRVTLELDGRHKHQGNLYNARVDITLPGTEIVADSHPMDEDVYVAIRNAFEAATRQLEAYAQRRRREVKNHMAEPKGQEY